MKQKNGIICLETEWEHTIERNRRSIHTKPLLEFLEKSSECEIIYRRVATKNELHFHGCFHLDYLVDLQTVILEIKRDGSRIGYESLSTGFPKLRITE